MSEAGARPEVVFFTYPYFMDSLYYSVVALERRAGPSSSLPRCLWAVANVRGDVLNSPLAPIDAGDDAATLAAYTPPTHAGSSVLFLLYVQPTLLTTADIPATQRGAFDVDEWSAAYGMSFPSASAAFVFVD